MPDEPSDLDRPYLAGALIPPAAMTPAQRKRARRNEFSRIPPGAYEDLLRPRASLIGRFLMVNDPVGVKRVLVDNVANYPKRALERRFFSMAFGDGLIGSEGDLWRAHRRTMAPAFDPRSVAAYAPAMTATAEAFRARWDALAPGAVVDIADEMTALTLQIISRTMFSTDSDEIMTLVDETLRRAHASLNIGLLDLIPLLAPSRDRRRSAAIAAVVAELDRAVEKLIGERERAPDAHPVDLLARLVAAKDRETGARLTAREVRDEVVTIFVAGHETTAMALTWAWYLLAMHPQAQARLQAEIDAVVGGRPAVHADLAGLAYTRNVMDEAMRLYPPVPGLSGRQAIADDVVCGRRVAAGTTMIISPFVLHRHRKLWDDPERFDPDRFSPERSAGRSRFAYLPFGAGQRVCIGAALATDETMLILAALASRHHLALVPGQDIDLQQRVTLRPRAGMKMTVTPRA